MRTLGFAAWLLLAGVVGPVAAQDSAPQTMQGVEVDTLAVEQPGLLVLAAEPDPSFDLIVARQIRSPGLQQSRFARGAADVTEMAALPGSVLLAGLLYGIGELDDRPDLRELGLHTGQAVFLAGGVSLVGKVAVGRSRPRISPEDPYQLAFGRGIRGDDYQSFPSAHTAVAFASAVVLATDLGDRHPKSRIWIVPVSYGAAGLAGASRIFHDHHWATDVIAGALVGVLSGWGVTHLHGSSAN